MRRAALIWLLRLGLAALYLFAAVPKIIDPWSFSRSIMNFRILPEAAIPPLAVWLPLLEGFAALALLTGWLRRGGLLALSGCSAVFAAAIASAIVRGLDIDCGCFGAAADSRANWGHLALNLAALAAGIILLAFPERSRQKPLRRA